MSEAIRLPEGGAEEARQRRALLAMLEDLKDERALLRRARQQWLATADALEDPLVVHDAEGRIARANKAYAMRAGMDVRALQGRPWRDCFPRGADPAAGELTLEGGETFLCRLFDLQESGGGKEFLRVFEDVTERRRAERDQAQLAAIVSASLDAIYSADPAGRITVWNAGAERLLGYGAQEALGRQLEMLIPPGRAGETSKLRERVLRGEEIAGYETVRRRKDGTLVDVLLTLSPIRGHDGEVAAISGIARDITERKLAEAALARTHRALKVMSGIDAAIVRIRDRDELYREACRIAVEAGGFRLAWLGRVDRQAQRIVPSAWHGAGKDYLKHMPLDLRAGIDRGLGAEAIENARAVVVDDIALDTRMKLKEQALSCGFRSLALLPIVVEGEVVGLFALYADAPHAFDEAQMQLLGDLAADIAFALDHIDKAEKVEYLAYYDALTGLSNHALFLERLGQSLAAAGREGRRLAVAAIDIARLNAVNSSLGRAAGDALLRQFATRLAAAAGERQVGRLAGDLFGCVLEAGSEHALHERLDALRAAVGAPYEIGETPLRVDTRVGVALFPADGGDAEALAKNAEAALKAAKAAGDSQAFYARRMTEGAARSLSLESALRLALERDEFVLHYQPKVDAATRAIAGAEALMRWQSPERGLVPPAQFIGLLEETGLILQAGAWALERAARDHRAWADAGLEPPRVTVNVSAVQLRQRDFVAAVERALAAGAGAIDLEITESLIMTEVEANIVKLLALRELGIGMAIDDFGTGYSSLAYLARLPVDTLKIDRSFVITMAKDPSAMTLVRTIISLARSLRLKVVAEGVDEEEQAKLLRLLRCDEMQGYLFSKPLPAAGFAALLEAQP